SPDPRATIQKGPLECIRIDSENLRHLRQPKKAIIILQHGVTLIVRQAVTDPDRLKTTVPKKGNTILSHNPHPTLGIAENASDLPKIQPVRLRVMPKRSVRPTIHDSRSIPEPYSTRFICVSGTSEILRRQRLSSV